jgi:acyl CoA:acetate/3-ketoacid CoA transferase beta subunit
MEGRELIVTRAARFFHDGDLVNLGIGLPTEVGDHLPPGVSIQLQSENGFIGLGPTQRRKIGTKTW